MYEVPAALAVKPAPDECQQTMTPAEALWSGRIRELIAEYQNNNDRRTG